MKELLTGADRILEYSKLFENKRIGIITTPTGINKSFIQTADVLAKNYHLTAMYAPEHGVRGNAQDGQSISSYIDEDTGAVVHSIYGDTRSPTPQMLTDIDIMVYDVQDVGSRYYTFIYTMANCMKACAQQNIPFVVLDRPNPVGSRICGTQMLDKNRSFIGQYNIPQQYGLTCAELAQYFNMEEGLNANLKVVPMVNYSKNSLWSDYSLAQISPSPNLPSFESVLLYNGTCMFEGLNVSEGRGTTKPFQLIGAPFINAKQYAQQLNALNLSGVYFRPIHFTPMFSKHMGKMCGGVQVHITNKLEVQPLQLGVAMVITLIKMYPRELVFVAPNHEAGDYTMDLLWGSSYLRSSTASIDGAFDLIREQSALFEKKLEKFRIYE